MTEETPFEDTNHCNGIGRRQFLTGVGATATLGVVGGYAIGLWRRDPAVDMAATATTSTVAPTALPPGAVGQPVDRTLVVVEFGGGNDALSTVVPLGTDVYHDLRRATAITEPIDLDGSVGLHPNLLALADRFTAGDVAIIEGVGYPDPDLSHFVSMETWWTAHASGPTASGWLGRYLDGTVGAAKPLAGVTIGPGPSRAMLGDTSLAVSIQDASGLSPAIAPWIDNVDELMASWAGFAQAGAADDPRLLPVLTTIAAATHARTEIGEAISGDGVDRTPRRGATLGTYLALAAQLVIAHDPPAVIYVHGWGDFDTHQAQLDRHGRLMTQFDDGVRTFFETVEQAGRGDRVALLTTSEFGRRVRDNGSGTDHGTAGTQLLIGAGVVGGRYGEPPSLTNLDPRGNPIHTLDFRSTYSTVIAGWMAADADTVLGGAYEHLPLFG